MASYCNYDCRYFVRKGSFMRRTNKKVMKKADDKQGVILITVVFIVAMALIFITTALTISIASRQRVYSNAKSDQARLTVTSLAQSLWQAIYSQQITDTDLETLAANDALVTFSNDSIPGMVASSGAITSAYFYYPDDTDTSKLAIECKCDIDGVAQYYRMVLQKNQSEGVPPVMFDIAVNIGDGGMLNSMNFGLDAASIEDVDRRNQVSYTTTHPSVGDNIVFIHNSATSNQDGSGFYCDLITDGILYMRDVVMSERVLFVGQNAGMFFCGTSSTNVATNDGKADIYFWGTDCPIYYNGENQPPLPLGATNGSASISFSTADSLWFDNRAIDGQYNTTSTGFSNFTYNSTNYSGLMGAGSIHFERTVFNAGGVETPGATYRMYTGNTESTRQFAGSWQGFNNGTDQIPTDMVQRLTVNADQIDTQSEMMDEYGQCANNEAWFDELKTSVDADGNPLYWVDYSDDHLPSGYTCGDKPYAYLYTTGGIVTDWINCNVAKTTVIYVDGGVLQIGDESGSVGCGFRMTETSGDNKVIFVLLNNAQIKIMGMNSNPVCGFVDYRCYSNTDFANPQGLIQDISHTPRFYMFTNWSRPNGIGLNHTDDDGGGYGNVGEYGLVYGNQARHENMVVNAFIGFFPSSQGGSDGAMVYLDSGMLSDVFYGRIACSGIEVRSSDNFNVPYCPGLPGNVDYREAAYRDNTNYNVVTNECEYFTA